MNQIIKIKKESSKNQKIENEYVKLLMAEMVAVLAQFATFDNLVRILVMPFTRINRRKIDWYAIKPSRLHIPS